MNSASPNGNLPQRRLQRRGWSQLTVQGVLAGCATSARGWFKRKVFFQCPYCGGPVPINAKVCPNKDCQKAITVNAAMSKPRQRWQRFVAQATTEDVRRVQWGYIIGSGVLLWVLLELVQRQFAEHWVKQALLSVVYLAVFALLLPLIVPRHVFTTIATRTGWRVRLGLLINYLSLLLLLQLLIGAFWGKALVMAGVFGVTCVAMWLIRGVLLPTFLPPPPDNRFDPTAPQGRQGRFD